MIQYHFGDRTGLLMAVVEDGVAELLANAGVAEVIWSTLRGVVLAQLSGGVPYDWQTERRVLIDMVSHYLAR